MNIECLKSTFCKLNSISTNCENEINNRLGEFKDFINNEFLKKAVGNLILTEKNFEGKNSISKVMNSLEDELKAILKHSLIKDIMSSTGRESANLNTPLGWRNHQTFLTFRRLLSRDLKKRFPTLVGTNSRSIIPDQVEEATSIGSIYEMIKVKIIKEINNLITMFCNGTLSVTINRNTRLMMLLLFFATFLVNAKIVDCPTKTNEKSTYNQANIYQCLYTDVIKSKKVMTAIELKEFISSSLKLNIQCFDGECENFSYEELNLLKILFAKDDSDKRLATENYSLDLYDHIKQYEPKKSSCLVGSEKIKAQIDQACDFCKGLPVDKCTKDKKVPDNEKNNLLARLKFFDFPTENIFFAAAQQDKYASCMIEQISNRKVKNKDDRQLLFDRVKKYTKQSCQENSHIIKNQIDDNCMKNVDIPEDQKYSLLTRLGLSHFPDENKKEGIINQQSINKFFSAVKIDKEDYANCVVNEISKTSNNFDDDVFGIVSDFIMQQVNFFHNNNSQISRSSLKKLLSKKFEAKQQRGYRLLPKKKNDGKQNDNEETEWTLDLSVGDTIDNSLSKKFTNPAKLIFNKSAGKETEEALNAAIRLDLNKIKGWSYSLGTDIEKSTGDSNSSDIRGYYYQQTRFFDRNSDKFNYGLQIGLNKKDNFKTGYESLVGTLAFSPQIVFDNNGTSKFFANWQHFKENKNDINKWEWFFTPIFGLEVNDLLEKPTDPELFFINDEDFVFSKVEMGLKRYSFEITYLLNRRYSIQGDRHLSYQTVSLDYYLDKNENFSIGLLGKIGQRPFDKERVEDYQLAFGFRL